MARNDKPTSDNAPRRKRGAQVNNRNAWRHGRRSRSAVTQRKLTAARLRALAHLAHQHGLLITDDRFRVRPVRADQIELLWLYDAELAAVLTQGGWAGLPSHSVFNPHRR